MDSEFSSNLRQKPVRGEFVKRIQINEVQSKNKNKYKTKSKKYPQSRNINIHITDHL